MLSRTEQDCIEKYKERMEAWEASPEGVANDLAYYGEHDGLWVAIVETVVRLPERVRRFALNRCRFVSIGLSVAGYVLPGRIGVDEPTKRSRNMWIVVLDETMFEHMPDDIHSVIAHEIAHAWRKDDRLAFPPDDCELKAANLAQEWGFVGKGADPEFANRPVEELRRLNEELRRKREEEQTADPANGNPEGPSHSNGAPNRRSD